MVGSAGARFERSQKLQTDLSDLPTSIIPHWQLCPHLADIVEIPFAWWTRVSGTADAFRARRREGATSFHSKRTRTFVGLYKASQQLNRPKGDFREIFRVAAAYECTANSGWTHEHNGSHERDHRATCRRSAARAPIRLFRWSLAEMRLTLAFLTSGRFAPEAAVRYPTGPSNDWVKKTCAKREMLVDRRAPADRSRCDKRAFPSVRSHQSLPRPIRAS